jgi:ABC-type antimicrobial peptide transport system permease subunit
MFFELFRDFISDLRAHRTRATLTLIAITWGTIAVVLLLSFGEGLGTQMKAEERRKSYYGNVRR